MKAYAEREGKQPCILEVELLAIDDEGENRGIAVVKSRCRGPLPIHCIVSGEITIYKHISKLRFVSLHTFLRNDAWAKRINEI
jgi:hypothetical protein